MVERPLEIAVARLGAIGDVLLTTPLLEVLHRSARPVRITYIVGQEAATVLDPSPLISDLIVWPGVRSRMDDIRLIRKIARRRFDLTISLSQSAKVNFALWRSGAPRRIGFTPVPCDWMLTDPVDVRSLPANIHRTQYFLSVAKLLNLSVPEVIKLNYTVTSPEREHAQEILAHWGIDPARERLIAIHPGSSPVHREKRRWAPEKFAEVARVLSRLPGLKVVILGGEEERELSRHFASAGDTNILDLTARLNFREFAAVLQRCQLLIHNDSGPMHLAGALGVPVVAIFGYQNHRIWGPIGTRDRVVRLDLPCSPCPSEFVCDRSFECLRTLDPSEVIAAAREVLSP